MLPRLIIVLFCLLLPLAGKAQDVYFAIPRYVPEQAEREVVAAVLVLEAANQGQVGMEAVMSVIDNRAKGQSALYRSVVTKPYQFSSLNSAIGNPGKLARLIARAKTDRTWTSAMAIVDQAAKGNLVDRTGGATFFVEGDIRPSWFRGVSLTVVIGQHRFFAKRTS